MFAAENALADAAYWLFLVDATERPVADKTFAGLTSLSTGGIHEVFADAIARRLIRKRRGLHRCIGRDPV
jgi:hypothetical protein